MFMQLLRWLIRTVPLPVLPLPFMALFTEELTKLCVDSVFEFYQALLKLPVGVRILTFCLRHVDQVLRMLRSIGKKENCAQFLEDVKARKKKLMGFGHRIYKSYDPRAKIMKNLAKEVRLPLSFPLPLSK
jgi:hypothetical protein